MRILKDGMYQSYYEQLAIANTSAVILGDFVVLSMSMSMSMLMLMLMRKCLTTNLLEEEGERHPSALLVSSFTNLGSRSFMVPIVILTL